MADADGAIPGWIRPLSLSSFDELPFAPDTGSIDPSFLLQELCQDFSQHYLENMRMRYWQLTNPQLDIFIVPNEKRIMEKLVRPLMAAKQSFVLKEYVGCIGLCGMVCEMAVIFYFELLSLQATGKVLTAKEQKRMFGTTFERLGQERRIEALKRGDLLPSAMAADADRVRQTRRRYLHFLSQSHSRVEKDAAEAYTSAFRVIKSLIDLPVGDKGSVRIPEHLVEYLKQRLGTMQTDWTGTASNHTETAD